MTISFAKWNRLASMDQPQPHPSHPPTNIYTGSQPGSGLGRRSRSGLFCSPTTIYHRLLSTNISRVTFNDIRVVHFVGGLRSFFGAESTTDLPLSSCKGSTFIHPFFSVSLDVLVVVVVSIKCEELLIVESLDVVVVVGRASFWGFMAAVGWRHHTTFC